MPTMMIRLAVTLSFSLFAFTMLTSAWAAGPTLTVSADGGVQIFDRDALLARPDVVEITTSRDVAYRTPQTYRAVALARLLEGVAIPPNAVVEAAAQDGFVTQLPRDLVYGNDGIVGYVAIEAADKPWPPIPGKAKSAGPFYIVWIGPRASSVPIMKWPYQVVSLSVQDAPARRWPSLAVDPTLPALHPARDGQIAFVNKCFTCHTMNRAGPASAGPDLNLPMNPTEYFTDAGLRALIRDPRSVRVWPEPDVQRQLQATRRRKPGESVLFFGEALFEFSLGIGQGEMPPLFAIGQDGKPELVNYRVYRNFLIADRLFAAAELRLGGEKQQRVRIVRSDGGRS